MNNLINLVQSLAICVAVAGAPSASAQLKIQPSANGEVVLVVDLEVKPTMEAEFLRAFQRSVLCTRMEPGNVIFNLHKVHGSERRYVLYEVWRSEQALNTHFETPYTKALFATFDKTLSQPVTAGGLRFLAEIDPAPRRGPVTSDAPLRTECR
jgi:quinol monooxygenase YgiN